MGWPIGMSLGMRTYSGLDLFAFSGTTSSLGVTAQALPQLGTTPLSCSAESTVADRLHVVDDGPRYSRSIGVSNALRASNAIVWRASPVSRPA